MKYLTNIIKEYNGNCEPLSGIFKDSNDKVKFPTNITVTSYNGGVVVNTRITDYAYIPLRSRSNLIYVPNNEDTSKVTSCNIIKQLYGVSLPVTHELVGEIGIQMGGTQFKGLEDVRLVVWNNTLYGVGFRPDIQPKKVIVQLIEFNEDYTIRRTWFINTNKNMEKNWQPVEDMPFTFMYDPDSAGVVTIDIDSIREADNNNTSPIVNYVDTPDFTGKLSGSSQLIHLKDGNYLSICHTSHRWEGANHTFNWLYNHYFVLYDEKLNKIWTSEPFRFVDDCMEFCCGMCHHNNDLYISFSMYDGTTHIISIPFDNLTEIISQLRDNPTAFESMPNEDYMIQNLEDDKIKGIDKFIYIMYAESINRLANTDDVIELLKGMYLPWYFKYNIIKYLIVHGKDRQSLMKEFEQQ